MQQPDFVLNTNPVILSYLYQEGHLESSENDDVQFVDWIENPETELKGKHIFGFAPLSMVKHAETVTMLNYDTSVFREDSETVTVKKFAESVTGIPQTYTVRECDFQGIDIITSRHKAIVPYLHRKRIIRPNSNGEFPDVMMRASLEDIKGKHVFGQLPLHMAAVADTMSKYPMRVPKEWRKRELTMKQFEDCITGDLETYRIRLVS